MRDEIKQELTAIFDSNYGDDNITGLHDALLKIFLKGAEHGYQFAVEMACGWIESNAYLYVEDVDSLRESALIGDLRYVLEGGES